MLYMKGKLNNARIKVKREKRGIESAVMLQIWVERYHRARGHSNANPCKMSSVVETDRRQ
jgi:protein-tyrosine phosphatase